MGKLIAYDVSVTYNTHKCSANDIYIERIYHVLPRNVTKETYASLNQLVD